MRRLLWPLALLMIVGMLALGLVMLWNSLTGTEFAPVLDNQEKVAWNGLSSPVSLEDAQARAMDRTRLWAGDAFLVWIKGTWQPTAEWLEATYPPIAWSFYYYSPAKGEIASVTIRGDQLFWVPPMASPTVFSEALAPFPPSYGIDVAWVDFRAAGGEAFLEEHPGAIVQYRLRKEGESLNWVIFAVEGTAHFEVKVDASSGLVLTAAQ